MANIWCIGRRFEYLVSNTAVSTSQDGQIWHQLSMPFHPPETGSAICYHNGALIASSYTGGISFTSNFSTWTTGTIGTTDISITGIISTNKAVACARRHYIRTEDGYPAHTEVAQIYDSVNGEPDTWAMIYSAADTPSGFHNIKVFKNADIGDGTPCTVCVVVGDKIGNPFALYSLDLGETWTEIAIDNAFEHPFYDVEYDHSTNKWYFCTLDTIAWTNSLTDPKWSTTELLNTNGLPLIKMKINPQGQILALSSNNIWFSQNQENWIKNDFYGYQFKSVEWFDSKWVVGLESLLTQFTFYTSTDGINWVPENNEIQMISFTVET